MFGNEYARSFYSKFSTTHWIACAETRASDCWRIASSENHQSNFCLVLITLFWKSLSDSPSLYAKRGKKVRNVIFIHKQELFPFSFFPPPLPCRAECQSASVSAFVDCLFCYKLGWNLNLVSNLNTASQFNHIKHFRVYYCVSGPTAVIDVTFKYPNGERD